MLLNATSEGVNHPSVALPGQPTQDGRVALLTVRQLKSANASNGGSASFSTSLTLSLAVLLLTTACML